ncbi:hypothetical protein VCHA29O37_500016 [Vibrio chagasii]|nr:hypothetical protein VCHA29O37_500016 [Vibrio chagasii]
MVFFFIPLTCRIAKGEGFIDNVANFYFKRIFSRVCSGTGFLAAAKERMYTVSDLSVFLSLSK